MTFDFGGALGGLNDWRKSNRNMLLGAGSGFLSGDLGNVGRYAADGRQADDAYATQQKAEADRAAQINQTAQWARTQFPELANAPDELVAQMAPGLWEKQMMGGAASPTSDIQNYEYSLANPGFAEWQTQRGGAAEVSLTPTWGIDTDPASPTYNKPVLGQLNKAGQFVKTQLPAGIQPLDPATMAGEKSGATVDAKTAAAARAALPGAQQALTIAQKAIALVRDDVAGLNEQFGNTWGVPNRNLPTVPGVFQQSKGNWQANFSQAKGQGFMQAREMLKGGGPITDYEGMKGEAAFSRMEQAVAIGDKETFLLALKDFEEAVNDGYQKLLATASGEYSAGGPGITDLGNGVTIREIP
jgi:hypothetical protein